MSEPDVATPRRPSRAPVLALGGVGLTALLVLRFRDPYVPGSYGICPFETLTGWWCPLCGGLRATHDLVSLRFVDAISSNVLAVGIVAAGTAYFGYWAINRWRARPVRTVPLRAGAMLLIAVVLVAFTVLRNLPAGAALAP